MPGALTGAAAGAATVIMTRDGGLYDAKRYPLFDALALGVTSGALAGGAVGFVVPRTVWRSMPLR